MAPDAPNAGSVYGSAAAPDISSYGYPGTGSFSDSSCSGYQPLWLLRRPWDRLLRRHGDRLLRQPGTGFFGGPGTGFFGGTGTGFFGGTATGFFGGLGTGYFGGSAAVRSAWMRYLLTPPLVDY